MKMHLAISGIFIICSISGCIKKENKEKPMSIRNNVVIQDGEMFHYSIFTRGKKTGDFKMVNVKISDSLVKTYLMISNEQNKLTIPENYQEFASYIIVDIKKGSMLRYHFDETEQYVEKNKSKGRYYIDAEFGSQIQILRKEWNGYETRQSKMRVNIPDTSFPVWQKESFWFLGCRLLDWNEKGTVLIWADEVMKEPIHGTLIATGEEELNNNAGKFQCVRVKWGISDPFLGPLMRSFTEKIVAWVEKESPNRLIKLEFEFINQIWQLEKSEIMDVNKTAIENLNNKNGIL